MTHTDIPQRQNESLGKRQGSRDARGYVYCNSFNDKTLEQKWNNYTFLHLLHVSIVE